MRLSPFSVILLSGEQNKRIIFDLIVEKMAYPADELDKNRREVRFRREIALSERESEANESKFLLRSTASSSTGSYR